MSRDESKSSDKVYYQVFGGAFRIRVPEGTPEAMVRTNKLGKTVHELEKKAVYGKVEKLFIEDSTINGGPVKQLKMVLDANEDGKHPVLSFGVESKDGRDIMKKLPAIDFSREIRVMPYRFTPEGETEEISGVSIFQQDEDGKFTRKVENFFFEPNTKTYLHGFPTIDWDKATESGKKIYKIERDEFLLNYIQEHVLPKFRSETGSSSPSDEFGDSIGYPDEEVNPEDIPF